MRRIICLLFLCMTGSASFAQIEGRSGGILKPEQGLMDIRHYTVQLTIDPGNKRIAGTTVIKLVTKEPVRQLVFDLSDSLPTTKAVIDGKSAPFTHSGNLLKITVPQQLPAGVHEASIHYGGKPIVAKRPPWKGGFTWDTDSSGNPFIAVTCQLEGGKIYYPCKDHPSDEPNEGADLIITVAKGLVVAGPGLLVNRTTKGKQTTFHWQTKYTINNYSIVFNVGKFQVVERKYRTVDGHTVPLQFYVLEQHKSKAEHHLDIFERTIQMQEKYFGEYPWVKEKIAICETPHLGMEHQTMNAYGNKFKYTQVGGQDFDGLMHHEFGHEWWGNKITANDWADMWIQEGICTYGDALYIRDYEGEPAHQKRMREIAMHTANIRPIVQGKDLATDSVYISDIYGKGALFMHTLRYIIGDSIFFPALKAFATDPKYTYDNKVTTKDVQDHFSKASGKVLKPLFDLFIYSTNKLDIRVKQVSPNQYSLTLQNIKMELPVEVVTDGQEQLMELNGNSQIVTSQTAPIVDPDGWYLKRIILE
ncbi:MAG TPA: M1 family metallopeptidase [Flavitalea sp.]|nr:M1 family metallopeptidase [Flavitalea sp.]